MDYLVTFLAGASHGLTSVVVGQPLDTIKSRMQGMPNEAKNNSFTVARHVFEKEGIRGLYRGGLPIFIGGSLMRSAQFGVSGTVKSKLDESAIPLPHFSKVVIAGMAGGIGRGIVEVPADFLKIRKQVEHSWSIKEVLNGTGITLGRNAVLFGAFVVYVDLAKQACKAGYVPTVLMDEKQTNLSPFAKGAICANLAWLTVWPADVVKTMRQSGNYDGNMSSLSLLKDNIKNGRAFRGLVPGLIRSTIANGSSMVVYEMVESSLSEHLGLQRKSMV